MTTKITLELNKEEFLSILNIIETIESMYGCSDSLDDEGNDWDYEMKKEIKVFDKMLKRNKIKR